MGTASKALKIDADSHCFPTAAGQRTGAGGAVRQAGPIGHGQIEDRVTLLPETGFDMQVLIPDGIFANPFGSPIARQSVVRRRRFRRRVP
ncbi:MAG: hypothetical protein HYZ81_19255 [Nitrospinae bacterium]|nr:hypothetical protein [Nitrospinota bacterium]